MSDVNHLRTWQTYFKNTFFILVYVNPSQLFARPSKMPLNCTPSEKPELACVFASLILADEKIDVTAENIQKLLIKAKIDVEPYWPKLFGQFINSSHQTHQN